MSDTNVAEIVEEAATDVTAEMEADQLMEEEAHPTEPEEPEAEAETKEETTDDRKAQYTSALREMAQCGFTREELEGISRDEDVHKDLAAGKSLWAAAMAYRSRNTAQEQKPAKRAVPNVRRASAEKRLDEDNLSDKINRMSSKEFAEFAARAENAAMSGRRVSIR
jgi:hypothetical protein